MRGVDRKPAWLAKITMHQFLEMWTFCCCYNLCLPVCTEQCINLPGMKNVFCSNICHWYLTHLLKALGILLCLCVWSSFIDFISRPYSHIIFEMHIPLEARIILQYCFRCWKVNSQGHIGAQNLKMRLWNKTLQEYLCQ